MPPRPRALHLWSRAALCAAVLLLGACAHAPQRNPLAQWVPSPNQDARRPILIVLHFTDQHSVQQSLTTLRGRNSGGRVSAHYLIGEDGRRYQLVADSVPGAQRLGTAVSGVLTGNAPGVAQAACTARR